MTPLVRRLATVAVAIVSIAGMNATAASAAGPIRAWIGAPDFDFPYLMRKGYAFEPTFGLSNVPDRLEVTFSMDLSDLDSSRVAFEFLPSEGCSLSGKVVSCTPPLPPPWIGPSTGETMSSSVRIRALDSAQIGFAGNLTVRSEVATNTARIPVYVVSPGSGADMEITGPDVSGKVGDVVPVKMTLRNLGPNVMPEVGVQTPGLSDNLEFVSFAGCKAGSVSAIAVPCKLRGPLEAGSSVTVSFSIRIVRLKPLYSIDSYAGLSVMQTYFDPNQLNNMKPVKVNVAGASGPGANTGSGSGSGGGGPAAMGGGNGEVTAVVASPSAVPADTPVSAGTTPAVVAGDIGQERPQAVPAEKISWWPLTAAAGLLLCLGGGLTWLVRRRRPVS